MTANSSVMNARPRAFHRGLRSCGWTCRLDQRLHHIAPHFANTTTFGMTLSANTSYVVA